MATRGCGCCRWRCGSHSVVRTVTMSVVCVLAVLISFTLQVTGRAEGSMEITAFEYFRKFGKHLELGECPQRELQITLPNKTTILKQESCKTRQKGNVTHDPRELQDVRNVILPTANHLVAYIGLCGGQAASYVGLLNNGDCLAVEIASKLTFNKKTLVRAYYVYYFKSLDVLDTSSAATTNSRIREAFGQYMEEKYYVKNRSYGTVELVLVQFRFRNRKQTEQAVNVKVPSDSPMSEYMKKLEREAGKPRRVMVLTLSTATEMTYKVNRYDHKQWGAAIRDVEIREAIIALTQQRISSGRVRPNLNYQLFPFVPSDDQTQSSRLGPLAWEMWEKTSMLEVSLRSSISKAKKSARQCRKNKTKLCRRVRELRRKLVALQADVHRGRSHWMTLTLEEQRVYAARYSRRVSSFARMTKTLSREVRKLKKKEQLKTLNAKKKKANQVLVTGRIMSSVLKKGRDWSYVDLIKRRRERGQAFRG